MSVTDVIARLLELDLPRDQWARWVNEQPISDEVRKDVLKALDYAATTKTSSSSSSAGTVIGHEGMEIDKYRLLRFIARGGFGEVWEAVFYHFESEEGGSYDSRPIPTCLKLLLPSKSDLADVLAEARAMAAIRHENVVSVHRADCVEAEGKTVHYIEMQLVGEMAGSEFRLARALTVEARGEEGPRLTPREIARIMAGICHGVHAAHMRNKIHRDLKPDNVLIEPVSRRPKVTDFGLAASAANADDETTMVAQSRPRGLGTPAYMSPEQARESIRRVLHGLREQDAPQIRAEVADVAPAPDELDQPDPPTQLWDVYSLGAILSFMFTGTAPFRAEPGCADDLAPWNIMKQVARGDPPPPAPANIPRTLARIRDMAMSHDPKSRYQGALQMAGDLQAFLGHLPTLADPPSPVGRAVLTYRRHQTVATLTAAFLIFAAAGLVGYVWSIKLEQQRTHYRFQQVRSLANGVLEDCENLEDLLGSTATVKALVNRAQDYLEKLSTSAANDSELLKEVFDAYIRVGDIHLNSLGDIDAASASYEKALSTANRMRGDGIAHQHMIAFTKRGEVHQAVGNNEQALKSYERALEIAEHLYREKPNNSQARFLAACLDNAASMTSSMSEVKLRLERARSLRERLCDAAPDNLQYKQELAISFDNLGDLARQSNPIAAQKTYQESLRLREMLPAEKRGTPSLIRELNASYERVASIHENLSDFSKAMELYAKCAQSRRKLADGDPMNMQWQRDLSISLEQIGQLQTRQLEHQAAAETLEECLRIRRRLLEQMPRSAEARLDLCRILLVYATGILPEPARRQRALALAEEFLGTAGELAQTNRAARAELREWACELAMGAQVVAAQSRASPQPWWRTARDAYSLAIEIAVGMQPGGAAPDPAIATLTANRSRCKSELAKLAAARIPPG